MIIITPQLCKNYNNLYVNFMPIQNDGIKYKCNTQYNNCNYICNFTYRIVTITSCTGVIVIDLTHSVIRYFIRSNSNLQ